MLIQLNKHDMTQSEVMGADTVKLCEMAGFNPRLENDNQSRVEANQWGFKAEFAVARVLGLAPPTLTVTTDGGADLWIDGETTIDVKFTNMANGPLIFDSMAKFRSNIAVLCGRTKEDDVVRINGWITREAFKNRYKKFDFGYGLRLMISADDLEPIETLWKQMIKLKYGATTNENRNSIRFGDDGSEMGQHQGQLPLQQEE